MEKRRGKKEVKDTVDADGIDGAWSWLVHKGFESSFLLVAVFGLLIRVATSLHSYSGAGNPPKFGDYEAQRHWMEITLNLPVQQWYLNSTTNDLSYWGLDYPPLTAYQSLVHGIFVRTFDPDSVSLFTSRGYESYTSKLLMRWTVLSSDVLVFFPAVLWFLLAYYGGRSSSRSNIDITRHITMILLSPCMIVIDHGHFQYNCISLGLTVAAVAAVLSQMDLVACVMFSLAMNHKQMSAYYAPAFFSHLLGKCLRRRNPLLEVSKLGFVVLGTFAAVWWPYIHSTDAFFGVLSRLAPFERGIYEDYVANFWCTTSVLIKWKRLFTTPSLKLLSLAATIGACLPSMVQQVLAPSNKGFLHGLLNSSLSFYLFSFQVHEKSILLPLLPASLLAMEFHSWFRLLTHYAMFSMFPLLRRDKLVLAYVALYVLFVLIDGSPCWRKRKEGEKTNGFALLRILLTSGYLFSLLLHVIYLTFPPPERYPYLFEAVIMLLCFSHFVLFACYTNAKQWKLSRNFVSAEREKKVI